MPLKTVLMLTFMITLIDFEVHMRDITVLENMKTKTIIDSLKTCIKRRRKNNLMWKVQVFLNIYLL